MLSKPAALLSLAAISAACWADRSAQASAGWQTYRNPGYRFTIAYPPDMRIYNSARGENPGGYASVCSDITVACFGYTGQDYKGTHFGMTPYTATGWPASNHELSRRGLN